MRNRIVAMLGALALLALPARWAGGLAMPGGAAPPAPATYLVYTGGLFGQLEPCG